MVIIHETVRMGRAFHRHQLRGGERVGGWLSRPKARRRERQEAQGHAEGAAEGARHRLFSSSYLTGTARVAGLRLPRLFPGRRRRSTVCSDTYPEGVQV